MDLPSLSFSRDSISDLGAIATKEWIITNGLGSYASQTVPALNTRKYHGLLVAALQPPGNRTVCLSKLDEDIITSEGIYRLGSNEFQNSIYPEGYKFIEKFLLAPFPRYVYSIGDIEVVKTIFMPYHKNAVATIYNLQNHNDIETYFRVYPLLTCRYFHSVLNRSNIKFTFDQESRGNEIRVVFQQPQAGIICHSTEGEFKESLNWIERLKYREESFRGEASFDDCFQPGYFELKVPARAKKSFSVTCAAATQIRETKRILDFLGYTSDEINSVFEIELDRQKDLLTSFYNSHYGVPMSDWLNWMLLAANSFVVQNTVGKRAVIAGYHWFESWGRDTFISLPGLALITGRFSDARDILKDFAQYCKDGLIPNFISDQTGVPAYNTVDGTLWYINSVLQYIKYTGDFAFINGELWGILQSIIENHQKGIAFDIRLDDDGLLMHGPRLTWMDAVVEEEIVTPRAGKAVEIQALWYNALCTMEFIAKQLDQKDLVEKYATMAKKTALSFNNKYWNNKLGCLFDVLELTGEVDASLRPNQIFAVSLEFTMIDDEKSRKVVDVVNRELVTPFGLRTLSLDDPKFVGKCIGDQRSRDTAYHNGTIWPWLLGPYVTAYIKVNNRSLIARKQALKTLVVPLLSIGIQQSGLGTLNEIYDCDPPNDPRGCISQAWSVSEPLRAYVEDVLDVRPKSALSGFDLFF